MTLRDIWIPGKLSLAYVAGEREKYMKPGRFLLVTALLYFAILVFKLNINDNDLRSNDIYSQVAIENVRSEMDSLEQVYPIVNKSNLDSIKKHLFTSKKDSADLLLLNPEQVVFFGKLKNYPILKKDVAELKSSDIFEKYGIHSYFEQLAYGQFFKIYKDRAGALKFAVGNMAWTFILSIFLMAFVNKILYIRHGMYYVEHVIFFIHFYSFSFLIFILFGGYRITEGQSSQIELVPISFLIISIFFFLALKRYYQQGIIKSVLKALIIFCAFFLVIGSMALLILTLSAFFF